MKSKFLNRKRMKKLFLLLLIIFPLFTIAQGKIAWDFNLKPGAQEWKLLKSNQEKVDVCQIPTHLLTELETKELLDICLNYPLLPDIFAFNNVEDGFIKFEKDFNGFRELITRNDAMNELLILYTQTDPSAIPINTTIIEKGNYVLKISFIELFASHTSVTNKSTTKIKKEFVKELVLKNSKKKLKPEWYNSIGTQTNFLSLVKIIKSDTDSFNSKLNNSELTSFIYTRNILPSLIQDLINEVANEYLTK